MKNLQELPKLSDSVTYLYLEHAIIEQSDYAIVAVQKNGRIPIPVSTMTCFLLGPGTSITHAAVRTICENGCMAVWCGEGAGRFYAAGTGETRSSKNLLKQAKACMNDDLHMSVVRRMYEIRFPNIKTDHLTLQQIRGMEGIRVRKAYELASKTSGVAWKKRSYKDKNWDASDPINQALSEANALLYGICHAAIVSLGYSPGLGFVHTGKQLSFVYDIADLYKADTTIPAAFEAVKNPKDGISRTVRINCRNYFARVRLLSRIANDIAWILDAEDNSEQDNVDCVGNLWDETTGSVSGGKNYAAYGDEP